MCLDVQPHRERKTDDPIAVAISCRDIRKICVYPHSTLLPVGMAHGRKFLVMRSCQNSDYTSDHGKDACRGRKEQLDRSLFFHRGGGGGSQGWTWVCWAGPDDGLVLGCLVLRGVEGRELLLLTSCWLEEDEMRQVHCRHCYPPLSGLEWSCSTASTFNTVFHAISRICEQHRRYRVNVGALAHFHCSSSTQHEQTLWQD